MNYDSCNFTTRRESKDLTTSVSRETRPPSVPCLVTMVMRGGRRLLRSRPAGSASRPTFLTRPLRIQRPALTSDKFAMMCPLEDDRKRQQRYLHVTRKQEATTLFLGAMGVGALALGGKVVVEASLPLSARMPSFSSVALGVMLYGMVGPLPVVPPHDLMAFPVSSGWVTPLYAHPRPGLC